MRNRALLAGCSIALLAGCPRQMNYRYQEKLPASVFGPPDTPEPAGREARQLLASARTVAFYPPDYCINVDKEDVARSRTLRANCGVLLSSLELAAEKAGYEVVSWQNLRGRERPIDYAREAKVDVLFEINEFDFGPLDDSKMAREMVFEKYETDGVAGPFTPPQDIANRCADYAKARRKPTTVAKIGVIDIKTVSVADGRNRWRYRKSLTRDRGVSYEKVAFGSLPKENAGAIVLGVLGGINLTVGGVIGLLELTISDDPTTDTDERIDAPDALVWGMVGGGAALLAGGIVLAALTTKPGGPDRMCLSPGTDPLVTPGSAGAAVDEEHENAELRSAMIGEFVDQIIEVRNSTPPPAPLPAPGPTAPDPNAPPAPAPAPPAPSAPVTP